MGAKKNCMESTGLKNTAEINVFFSFLKNSTLIFVKLPEPKAILSPKGY